jgi:hypothetical protein
MAFVSTDLLKEGMELESPVQNQHGQVLFGSGLVLKEKHIDMMLAWGIGEADIKMDEEDQDINAQKLKEQIRRLEESIEPRFLRCDVSDPYVREIIRYCAERKAEKLNRIG